MSFYNLPINISENVWLAHLSINIPQGYRTRQCVSNSVRCDFGDKLYSGYTDLSLGNTEINLKRRKNILYSDCTLLPLIDVLNTFLNFEWVKVENQFLDFKEILPKHCS